MTRKPITVPAYLVPLAKKIRHIERIIAKGLVIDSPTVKSERQPNGRVQLKLRE